MMLKLRSFDLDHDEGTTANEIIPGLWMGGKPPVGPGLSKYIDVLVLMAKDFQPSSKLFPDITVLHAPMTDDHNGMPAGDSDTAMNTAMRVAKLVKQGKRVLVTCWAGRNRSGLVTALALMLLKKMNPDQAVGLIRAARSELAMRNPHFNNMLVVIYAALVTSKVNPSSRRTRT